MTRNWLLVAALLPRGCSVLASSAELPMRQISQQTRPAQGHGTVSAGTDNETLIFEGGADTVKVRHNPATISEHGSRDVEELARYGSLIALSDAYPSKSRGASLCQAGRETWFRVIDLARREERYARLVDSCWGDEQWGDPPVTVAQNGAQITLNLLSEPPITLTLTGEGRISASR
ncbi:hypothetical protein C7I55_13160 [Sphingomonas deserti]|uniref:Uncharacterized protein n=2 Tax=Allosphingosinicella deserti TaxID=2116704 RepID=A0A2P7QNM9_9SPHN|nr:hypothetical protein C7I55_13160 [Sphingomonas deserti]